MDSLPSPAVSPESSPNNSPSTPLSVGRKRARSSESQASSSKRAMSEDPSAAEQPQTTTLSPTKPESENDEIDAYMREQGEQENQHAAFGAPAHFADFAQQQLTEPSPSEKLQIIKKLKEQPMVSGDTWYVISRSWYRRWEKACTGEVDKEGAILESQLGPVDNSPFFKDGKFDASRSMIEGVDVEFVPSEAWNAFTRWYGEPPHVMARQVITRGVSNEASLELRPLCFPVFRLAMETSSAGKSPERYITISSQAKLADLYLRLLEILGLPPLARFRTWVIDNVDAGGASITPSELVKNEGRLLPSDDRSVLRVLDEFAIQSNDGLIVEVNEDDAWLIDEATLQQSVTSQAQSSSATAAVFSYSDFYSKLDDERAGKSSSSAHGPSPSISTYGKCKVDRKGTVPGTIGFSNMGNTCFMNSALQCLAHTEELAEYFLTGVYHDELNPDNPLGMQGAIAEAFGAILNRVWLPQSSAPYAPREFKTQLQRFAPQFTGYQQHDSQELVAFLLDGLHEDLNRVLKKPYVEKPDWHGGGDKELVMLAKESWEGYMKRNDSVIVDLFQGQYKSTLICPECNKVSITFDPFMYLTLPLPVQKKWTHSILYIPWDASKPHVKVPVELNRNATFKELRQLLGNWMQSEPDNLLTLETFSNRFYKYLDDTVPVGDMSDADHIVCFELPCHAQQSRTWRVDQDSTKNHVILPVHLCKEIPSSHNSFQRPSSGFAHPFLVVLDNEQIRDRQRIYSAVVERLERWTKHAKDLYRWEEVTAPEEVTIPETRPKNSLTEIKENGDIVAVEEEAPADGDIVDGQSLVLENDSTELTSGNKILKCLGPKRDLFEMHIQSGHDKLGTSSAWSAGRWERWETREKAKGGDECPPLLFVGDALYCEWDDNFRSYFFGDEPRYEHSLWADSHWGEFIHPDFKEMREASKARIKKSITLEDCLKEFTKEEQLGEDDPWYCPQCKKHQQATKKFDVWTIPDVLVVHLKRFSNSRILRDKIDAFVDFPVEGLDLEAYSGEREVAKRIAQEGHDDGALGLSNIEEPLIYDLFAVDEHLGGLGGGHYRAYAKNHKTEKWYHFDDTHVSKAQASDAVNQNAYLLFYKRRTSRPLGGKTREKVEAARRMLQTTEPEAKADFQLPTPPEDGDRMGSLVLDVTAEHRWPLLDSSRSPSREDDSAIEAEDDLENGAPSFEDPQLEKDPFARATRAYDFPNPGSTIASPASSNAADIGDEDTPDMEFTDLEDDSTAQDDSRGDDTGVEASVGKTLLHDIDFEDCF